MATDPRIPESLDPREPSHTGGLRPQKPGSGRPGVIIAIIVAVVLLAAIVYFLPRAPKATPPSTAATVPQQPTGGQIQLQDIQMSRAPVGSSMYIQARLNNNGQQTITGIDARVRFMAQDGSVAGTQSAKVLGLKQEGQTFTEEDLTKIPIKPNDSRPVRIAINRVPQSWNHAMPEVTITAVTSHP